MTCATTSRTRHPAHRVGARHCSGGSVPRNAAKSARSSCAKCRTSTVCPSGEMDHRGGAAAASIADCGHDAEPPPVRSESFPPSGTKRIRQAQNAYYAAPLVPGTERCGLACQSLRAVRSSWRRRAGSARMSISVILPCLTVKPMIVTGRPLRVTGQSGAAGGGAQPGRAPGTAVPPDQPVPAADRNRAVGIGEHRQHAHPQHLRQTRRRGPLRGGPPCPRVAAPLCCPVIVGVWSTPGPGRRGAAPRQRGRAG
jgi:hypothetical protein